MTHLLTHQMGGCFCLTEISHGSNVRGMRTESRYDPASQCFVLHTPDFEAAKCWAGNLGNRDKLCVYLTVVMHVHKKSFKAAAEWDPLVPVHALHPYPFQAFHSPSQIFQQFVLIL